MAKAEETLALAQAAREAESQRHTLQAELEALNQTSVSEHIEARAKLEEELKAAQAAALDAARAEHSQALQDAQAEFAAAQEKLKLELDLEEEEQGIDVRQGGARSPQAHGGEADGSCPRAELEHATVSELEPPRGHGELEPMHHNPHGIPHGRPRP